MAIDRTVGGFRLYCDLCGESAPNFFDDYDEAVQYKKENGWKSRKEDGSWWDHCPDCQ